MTNRDRGSRHKTRDSRPAYPVLFALCFMFCVFLVSVPYAQEEKEEESGIELPPVKIEVVDTTHLDIPKERFRSFTKPDPVVYAPLSRKERPWYVPSTSIPEKIREAPAEAEKSSLISLTAQFGIPQALMYQALLTRGFDSSEVLLDVGRATLRSERTPELVGDPSNELGDFTIDRLRGAVTHQTGNAGLKQTHSMMPGNWAIWIRTGKRIPTTGL